MSLSELRHQLTTLRQECSPDGSLDTIIAALGQTIRHFFSAVENIDLVTLRCNGNDPEWLAFQLALQTLRKAIGYQISELAEAYKLPIKGELAAHLPQHISAANTDRAV